MRRVKHLAVLCFIVKFRAVFWLFSHCAFYLQLQMKVRKIIAVICLVVLCTQVIPLRQIGAMLFNNQITEELAHSSDFGKRISGEKEAHHFFPVLNVAAKELAATNNLSIYSRSSLVKLHIAEVPTPPPNI